jgi:hypothetical protein
MSSPADRVFFIALYCTKKRKHQYRYWCLWAVTCRVLLGKQGQCPVLFWIIRISRGWNNSISLAWANFLQTTFPFRVQQNVSSSALLRTSRSDAWPFTSKQVQVAGPTGNCRKSVNLVQFFSPFRRTAFIQNGNWVVVRHSTQKTSLHRWLLRRRHHAFHSAHHHIPFSR